MKNQILLIDGKWKELVLLQEALKIISESFKFTYSNSGSHAINILNVLQPDFIFINLELPEMNGIDMLLQIRKNSKLDNASVFIYSEAISKKVKRTAIRAGAAGCFVNPGNLGMLIVALAPLIIRLTQPVAKEVTLFSVLNQKSGRSYEI